MDPGFAEVGVQEDRPAALLSERDRQVRRRDGLPFARDGAGHEQRPDRRIHGRELHVRAQGPIGLGRGRPRIQDRGQAVDLALPLGARAS